MANARTEFFVTPEGRFVWAYLDVKRDKDFQNKPIAPADQYYEVTIFIPKTAADPRQCRNYGALAAKVWEAAGQQWKGQWKQGARWPLLDCDAEPAFLDKNPWSRGHWRFTASGNFAPRVVDYLNNDVPKSMDGRFTTFKGGDYGVASVNCWAYDTGVGGVSFGIEGVKKTRDGDPVGGGQRSPEAMFGGPAPSAAAPPLPPGYAGQQAPAQFGQHTTQPPNPNYTPPQVPYTPPGAPQPGYPSPGAPQGGYAPYSGAQAPYGAPQDPSGSAGSYPSSGAPVYGGAPPAPQPGYGAPQGYGGTPPSQPGYPPPAPQQGLPPQPPVPFGTR